MTRLISAEWFKLRTTRMYLGLLLAASGIVVLVTALQFALGDNSSLTVEGAPSVIESEADLRLVFNVSGVAVLFTLVLGATALAGEHRHQTIASTFLLTPSRARVVVAKVIAYMVAGAVFGLVVEAAAVVVAVGWLAASGAAIPFGSTVVAGLALGPVAIGLAAGFGVGISAAIPNQMGAVLVSIGWVILVEQLLSGLVPAVARWLPFTGASTAIAGQHPDLGAVAGVGLFLLYLVAVVAVGIQVTRSRDVA